MRGADGTESLFQKGTEIFDSMAQLEARQLKRTSEFPHILAGGGKALSDAMERIA